MSDAAEMLSVFLNGATHAVPQGCTVAALLESLGLRREGVAVAVNMQVVPRSEHGCRVLLDGERVEVVQAVGGG